MLSDMAKRLPSTLGFCEITTLKYSFVQIFKSFSFQKELLILKEAWNNDQASFTWNLLMSLGLPAFFRQF